MDDIYRNIEECNSNKKRQILIIHDDMISDMVSNKKINPIVTKLFIRGKKVNISFNFMAQFYFATPKNTRLNFAHYFIMEILNKQDFKQIVFNHSSDIDFKEFINIYKKRSTKPYTYLVIDANVASDICLRFRQDFLDRNVKTNHDN